MLVGKIAASLKEKVRRVTRIFLPRDDQAPSRPLPTRNRKPRLTGGMSLFDGIDTIKSGDALKNMLRTDKPSVTAKPERTKLGKLGALRKSRFDVAFEDCIIECYLKKSSTKKLYVFLSGAGRKGSTATKFDRLSWSGIFDGNCLYIEDPMYKKFPGVDVGWYYGTRDFSFMDHLVAIVSEISRVNHIENDDIYLIGSSCAGYAAITVADKLPGTTAISFNPQIVPAAWDKKKRFEKSTGIDLLGDDKFGRNNIAQIFKNPSSRFIVVSNILSERDYVKQILPVFEAFERRPQYGLNVINNAHIILAELLHPFDHGAFPGPMETRILISLMNDGHHNDALVPYVEMLKANFAAATRLKYASLWAQFLSESFPKFAVMPAFCDSHSCILKIDHLPDAFYYKAHIDWTQRKCAVSFNVKGKNLSKNAQYSTLMRELAQFSKAGIKESKDHMSVYIGSLNYADLHRTMVEFMDKTQPFVVKYLAVEAALPDADTDRMA